jgi:hypothetical protein
MKFIIEEIKKEGVVGEEDSMIVLTLKIMLRLVRNANPTSSNVLVSDTTGGGKDFLTKNVCNVLLEKDITCFHRTNLSPKVLNYWQPYINKKKVSWDGRVLYLEDPEEELIKCQSFKILASGETNATVVKDQKVLDRKIDGKPVIIVTSMKSQIDVEGQRRWDAIRIDTSQQLSKKVVQKSIERDMGLTPTSVADETFRALLRNLREYEVIIPWGRELMSTFANPRMVERTQVNKLLDYIKASATLHQYNRKEDKDGRLIAEKEDYELARFAYIHLRNKEGNALNKQEEALLDYLRSKKDPAKLSQITTDLDNLSKTWLFEHKEDMVEKGIISTVTKFDASANREIEHLQARHGIKYAKDLPSGKKLLKVNGYISDGQLYQDINKDRKKEGLLPIFKKVI